MIQMKTPSVSDGASAENDTEQDYGENRHLNSARFDDTTSGDETPGASQEAGAESLIEPQPGTGFDASQRNNKSATISEDGLRDSTMRDPEIGDLEIGDEKKPAGVDSPQESARTDNDVVPHHLARTVSRTLSETGTSAFVVIRDDGRAHFFSRNKYQPLQRSTGGENNTLTPEYQLATQEETLEIVERVNSEESEVVEIRTRRSFRRGIGIGLTIGLVVGLISVLVVLLLRGCAASACEEETHITKDDSISNTTLDGDSISNTTLDGDSIPNTTLEDASTSDSALEEVLSAGKLRCGVSQIEGYAMKDPRTERWEGLEADLVRVY
jgi:hypothetical protein